MNTPSFKAMSGHEPGTILRLLQDSYRALALPQIDGDLLRKWEQDWRTFDKDIFNHPDTIGTSGFITYKGESIIGFASWDPRKYPTAIIGHTCILPAFRRNGYGKRQIEEILIRLRPLGFTKARVTTGEHPGFIAALNVYRSCGFHEIRRFSDNQPDSNWKMVELEKQL